MINLIQTFYTCEGENMKMGFSTKKSMKEFLLKSFDIQIKNYNVKIYTDNEGYGYLLSIGIPSDNLILFDFSSIKDERFWNYSKMLVHKDQKDKYIHVDIDACIYDNIDFNIIITEMYRRGFTMTEYYPLGLEPVSEMVTSGILGFADMDLKNKYCDKFFEIVDNWKLPKVTYESLWTCEELMLTNILNNMKIKADILPNNSYIHLQGGRK